MIEIDRFGVEDDVARVGMGVDTNWVSEQFTGHRSEGVLNVLYVRIAVIVGERARGDRNSSTVWL